MQSWNSNTSTGITLFFGFIGILLFAAGCRYVIQRRQLSSGREIGSFVPQKKDGELVFDHLITIATGGKWCRLLLTFKSEAASEISLRWKYFRKRAALVTGTPYTLTISDGSRRVLYREEDKLSRFLAFVGGRGVGTDTLFSDRGRGSLEGRITLLEFFPRQAGSYRILLQIQSRLEDKAPGSSSYWEVIEAELTLKEDIIPLSKTAKYPHKRVQI
jgi:hypothetical protein